MLCSSSSARGCWLYWASPMCGIFAWILAGDRRHDRELLVRLTDLMSHRGPDGGGYWLGDNADGRYQIGLGHRRLSIIDLGGGAQPMWSADRAIAVTFNGEIYNYIELRQELAGRGHVFRTSSDTEVLIEAYKAWGLAAIARLRGMFAFALWDQNHQRMVIARDPFGKKPLFLAEMAGVRLFSSEIEPIMQFPGIDRTMDYEALQDYFLNRYVPGPSTLFRAVKKLLPGCYAVWQAGHFSVTRYFTPPFATTVPDVANFRDAVQMFSEKFEDAVRIRMRSDAPFGAYLSGGVDSSAVVATMVRCSSARVRTYSVGFAERGILSLISHAQLLGASRPTTTKSWSSRAHLWSSGRQLCCDGEPQYLSPLISPSSSYQRWPLPRLKWF